jgi:clan AA aspartic protease (TIGR02281 family)
MQRRRFRTTLAVLGALALPACAAPPPAKPVAPSGSGTQYIRAPLTAKGGVPYVQIGIDGVCCFPFMVDSGASDVTVSPEVFMAMVNGGHITKADFIDVVNYRTASGAMIEGLRFRMPPMSVGGRTVHGVVASVSPGTSGVSMLLGQSFLKKFRFFAIDNANGVLVLGG